MSIKPGDLLSTDLTMKDAAGSVVLAASGQLTVTVAPPNVDPIPPDPGPDPIPEGAAKWITPDDLVISSLEVGHLGHIYAWGGTAFGYGYKYSIEDAPPGLAIDPDSGRLSLAATLAVQDFNFKVVVADRVNAALTAKFPFLLHVKKGVSANRTGDQILHKTYDLASSIWGSPSGDDWTTPLQNMRKQIIADQNSAGEGNLRADIVFQNGRTYEYTWNRWPTGIQYFRAMSVGAGAPPSLKCTRNDPNDPYNSGPLGTESSNAIRYQGSIKNYCALVASTAIGDNKVTLKNSSDGQRLKVGRYHAVTSGSIQLDGYPPNVRQIDYVKVLSISGTTVTLDRKLKYAHKDDYWEDQGSWLSLGRAYIVPWDLGDTGNDPKNPRMIQRGQFIGLNFVPGSSDISYMESFDEMYFERCDIPNPQFTMSHFVTLKGCNVHGGEPDKMTEQAEYIDCTNDAEMGGATGVCYFLIRGGTYKPFQVSPRQLRMIGVKVDATGNTHLNVPFSMSYNGPLYEYEFDNVDFVADGGQKTWTWSNPPVSPLPLSSTSWIDDGSGQKNRLVVPRSFGPFQDWLVWTYEGLMVMTGTVQAPGNYGIIQRVSAPADKSALWLDITWKGGTKPTSGNLVIPQHGPRKLIWKNNTRISKGGWQDPSFVSQEGTPTNRPFPAGMS